MKIAISGSHAVGKSTLIEVVAATLPGFVVLEEPYINLLESGYIFEHPPAAEDFEVQLERSLASVAGGGENLLFDRAPADFLAYLTVLRRREVDAISSYWNDVAAAMREFDLIVYVPVERPDRIEVPRSTASDSVDAEGVMLWGNFIAHELFHFWNAQRFRSSERPATRWFSEGATEYFANRALVRGGIISPAQWLEKAEAHVAMYMLFRSSPVWNGVTLAEAGGATSRNRPGVYSGGWVASLCLDAEIRVATGDRAGLAEVMVQLDERFGATGTRYPAAALVEAASRVAGRDLGPFFRRYIDGDETLPVRDCLATFGLDARLKPYAGEAYIWEDPAAAPAERTRLARLLGR